MQSRQQDRCIEEEGGVCVLKGVGGSGGGVGVGGGRRFASGQPIKQATSDDGRSWSTESISTSVLEKCNSLMYTTTVCLTRLS